jgi:hypothetical protein
VELTDTLCTDCGMTGSDVNSSTAIVSTGAYVKQKVRGKVWDKAAENFLSRCVCVCVCVCARNKGHNTAR